jgi:hypothetical protein
LLAGQRIHQDDGAFRRELLLRLPAHVLFDAGGAEQFDGAHVEEGGARQLRSAAQPLDDQGGDSVLGQEHRGRQTDEAAARDQHRNVAITHAFGAHNHPPLCCSLERCYCRASASSYNPKL